MACGQYDQVVDVGRLRCDGARGEIARGQLAQSVVELIDPSSPLSAKMESPSISSCVYT